MKRNFLYLLRYYLFWVVYFVEFKLLFLLFNYPLTRQLPAGDIVGSFWHGLRMDLSAAGYLSLLPALLLALTPWWDRVAKTVIKWYSMVVLVLVTVLGLVDAVLYSEWGSRVGTMIFTYLKDFKGVIYSLTTGQWLLAILMYAALLAFMGLQYHWYVENGRKRTPRRADAAAGKGNGAEAAPDTKAKTTAKQAWGVPLLSLLLFGLLILPIRGGLNTSPLTFSKVYFSDHLYANHAAYNFFWNFFHSLTHRAGTVCPIHYMSEEEANRWMEPMKDLCHEQVPVHIHPRNPEEPVNVVVFLLESFSNRVVGGMGAETDYAPNLSRLMQEGISWSNFYATGSRSDKGFASVFAGYPPVIDAQSVMKYSEKMNDLNYLPTYFVDRGYDVGFYYGGDIDFYNTKIFLRQAGVQKIVERGDFPLSESMRYKWGASDKVVFSRMLDDFLKTTEPAMYMCFTLGTHNPFDMPDAQMIANADMPGGDYCNAVCYTDSCIGVFMDALKQSPKWGNTVCIFVADHTSLWPDPKPDIQSPEAYHIPMLWVGGAIDTAFVCDNYCMQTDLGATLCQQLGWEYSDNPFAKNMMGSCEYAIFVRDEVWGYVGPEAAFSVNRDTGQLHYLRGEGQAGCDSLVSFAKAYMQYLHLDFERR